MQSALRAALAAGLVALPGAAVAADAAKARDEAAFGVSVEGSTLGAGLSLGVPFAERFNVRGVYHGYDYQLDDIEDEESGATYEGELNLESVGLFADWHPFKGAFRITAGLVSNGNEIGLSGVANAGSTYDVGNCTFESDPADPLRVDGTVGFAGSAPYLGIGWGGNLNAEPGFFMTFDLGVLFSGSPDSQLSGRGSARNASTDPGTFAECGAGGPLASYQDVSTYPQFQQAVEDAEDDVNKETEKYELWPNVAIGLGWRF